MSKLNSCIKDECKEFVGELLITRKKRLHSLLRLNKDVYDLSNALANIKIDLAYQSLEYDSVTKALEKLDIIMDKPNLETNEEEPLYYSGESVWF